MRKNHAFVAVLLALLVVFSTNSAQAEWNWSIPNILPFGKKKDKSATPKFARANSRSQTSNPVSEWSRSQKTTSNKPSTLKKLSNGTKIFFAKTKDVLTPWKNDSNPRVAQRYTTGTRATTRKEKKSFLPSWLKKDSEPPQPKTVQEWMSQPRTDIFP